MITLRLDPNLEKMKKILIDPAPLLQSSYWRRGQHGAEQIREDGVVEIL